jgi:hypothetical protein
MNHTVIFAAASSALAASLLLAGGASAQRAAVAVAEPVEAIVTITAVDPEAKTVSFKGPHGQETTVDVPQARNLDRIKPGSRFKVVYAEAAAVAISQDAARLAASGTTVAPAARGANPGGMAVRRMEATGVVEAIDRKNRYMSIQGPSAMPLSVKVPEEVKEFDSLAVGDRITLMYTQAVAADMIEEPEKPKP